MSYSFQSWNRGKKTVTWVQNIFFISIISLTNYIPWLKFAYFRTDLFRLFSAIFTMVKNTTYTLTNDQAFKNKIVNVRCNPIPPQNLPAFLPMTAKKWWLSNLSLFCAFFLWSFYVIIFHIMLLAWDGKLLLEIKETCGIANEIDKKIDYVVIGKIAINRLSQLCLFYW